MVKLRAKLSARHWVVLATVVAAVALAACDPSTSGTSSKGPESLPTVLGTEATSTVPPPTTANHFITNLHGSTAPRKLGFNVFDTGASRDAVRNLPKGVHALVWLGEKCPTQANRSFRRTVRSLASLKRVFGYYLSDEPHIADCPGGPLALRSRADFIAKVSEGRQVSFIVLSETEDYRPFRTRRSHVTFIGVDPYPCSTAHPACDLTKIPRDVNDAIAAGIPRWRIVPVYQAFGQENTTSPYYLLPTATQMRSMLTRWASLVPHPRFDYTYGWGNQSSSNPTLVDSTALQDVFAAYFAG